MIAKIPNSTKVIYIPWQLVGEGSGSSASSSRPRARTSRCSARTACSIRRTSRSPGRTTRSSRSTPATRHVKAYATPHGGDGEYFGAPSYVATQVAVNAVTKACTDGKGNHARRGPEDDRQDESRKATLLGIPIDVHRRTATSRHGGFGDLPDRPNGVVQAGRLTSRSTEPRTCGGQLIRWAARVF